MKKERKICTIRRVYGFLAALCMVIGVIPATAFAQETVTQSSATDHVLKEENNWNISDELIMPGELFYTEPKYEFSYDKAQASGTLHLTACPRYLHAALTLNEPGGEGVRWDTSALVRSTLDTSKIVPGKTNSYNVIKIAHDRGDLSQIQTDDKYMESLKEALKGEKEVTAGYQNNTNLPMVLEQVRGSSTIDEGEIYGGEFGMDLLVDAWSTHNWACTLSFYEPYYMLSYKLRGIDGELTEEEKSALPDRYYIQREKQEIVLPNPVRAGYHFTGWTGNFVSICDVSVKDGNTILSFDWEHSLKNSGYRGLDDQTLEGYFESGTTVTFNLNGGRLKEGDVAIREIDTTDEEGGQFFDINECVPVRDGYKFAGWCTSPSAGDDSLIKNTGDCEWIDDWSVTHSDQYDIQVYAKWEKEDPCLKGHTPQENVTQATTDRDGKIVTKCSVCDKMLSETVIKKISGVKLSDDSYIYNGKKKTPQVVVKDSDGKTLQRNKDYEVTYENGRKNVGNYVVTINFKGNYSGTVEKTFTIKPKATSISKLKAGRKKMTVKWKKQTTQTTGYQIQYSTSSKFKDTKTVTITKNKTTSKTISNLKAKKKYYARIRTYKTVKQNGKSTKIYSSWSKAQSVKVK